MDESIEEFDKAFAAGTKVEVDATNVKISVIDEFESTPEGKAAMDEARREIKKEAIIIDLIALYIENAFEHYGSAVVEHAERLYEIARGETITEQDIEKYQPPRRRR